MVIKERINISDDKVTRGIGQVVRIINKINNSDDHDVTFDFSATRFTSPVFVILLKLFMNSCDKRVSVINQTSYFNTIGFTDPIRPDDIGFDEFIATMEKQEYKNYIPIICFPASQKRAKDKDAILSAIENMLEHKLKIAKNVLNGLKYIIGEMVDNITEHSESDRGYIFAQYYPTKGYMDLCIADEGITLFGSFKKAGYEMDDDIEAMQAANKGVSSKNLPDAENRGYGIFTTKKMLISGLGGQYMMMSGGAISLFDANTDQILELPNGVKWGGTIVALRLPTQKAGFNYSMYFE